MAIREVKGNPVEFWSEFSWTDLSKTEQKYFSVLGWDEASWEEETDEPSSSDKYWKELTSDEQAAATILGFTSELWDES